VNCVDYFGLSFFTFPGELSKNKKKLKCWLISLQSSLENITIFCVKLININIYTDVSRVNNLCQSSNPQMFYIAQKYRGFRKYKRVGSSL
jgi:hypothetical protein